MFPWVPPSPRDFEIAPLRGIQRNSPPHRLEKGRFLEVENYFVTPRGLCRRPGISQFSDGSVAAANANAVYPAWQDFGTFYNPTTGLWYNFAIDQKFIYTISAGGSFARISWDFTDAATVTTSGTTVTASADTHWNDAANEVQAGDVILIDSGGSHGGPIWRIIASVTNGTTLVTTTSMPTIAVAQADWKIQRAFAASNPMIVDWTQLPDGTILLADGSRYLYSFTGAALTDAAAAQTYIPRCVAFYNERIWIGDIAETGARHRNRIRWTSVGDYDDWTGGGYIDLPYTGGAIRRLVPLGNTLAAYFEDAIFIGVKTNRSDLPLSWQQLPTGGRGLVGNKAVHAARDGHYFVAQDGFYHLSLDRGLQPIGDPVNTRAIEECSEGRKWRVYVAPDILNRTINFGMPKSGEGIEEVFALHIESKEWSTYPVSCDALAHLRLVGWETWASIGTAPYTTGTVTTNGTATIEGAGGMGWAVAGYAALDYILIDLDADGNYEYAGVLAGVTDADTLTVAAPYPAAAAGVNYRLVFAEDAWAAFSGTTWESLMPQSVLSGNLFYGKASGAMESLGATGSSDTGSVAIPALFETGDFDANAPNVEKFWGEVGLKIEEPASAAISYTLYGSVNRGKTWKELGTITIDADETEAHVNFRMRGAQARFRGTSTSTVGVYTLNDLTFTVRAMGTEVPGREV